MFLFSLVGHLSLNNFVSRYTFDIDHSKHPIFIYFYLEDYCTGLEFQCEGLVVGCEKTIFFRWTAHYPSPPDKARLLFVSYLVFT